MKVYKIIELLQKYGDKDVVRLEVSTDYGDRIELQLDGEEHFIDIEL